LFIGVGIVKNLSILGPRKPSPDSIPRIGDPEGQHRHLRPCVFSASNIDLIERVRDRNEVYQVISFL